MAFRRKKKGQAEPQADDGVDPAERGTMTMVLEPGPVKHVHFGGKSSPPPAEVVDAPFEELPDEEPAPVQELETVEERAPLKGRRKTIYETERGAVLRYEKDGERRFATLGPSGERPFDPESDVDPLIGGVTLDETPPAATEEVSTYREVVAASEPAAEPPQRSESTLEEAWSPTHGSRRPAARPPRPRPARRSKPKLKSAPKKKRAARRPHLDFPGDDHLVIDLEGIGPIYAKKLQRQGVYTTSRLAYESPGNLAKRIKVPRKVVKGWTSMAELIKVKGIGKQYAEVLFRSGVKGIDDLKKRKPDELAKKVNKYLRSVDTTVIGTGVHAKRAKGWIQAAKKMRRRALPVPRKGPPQTETVKGFIEKLPAYGAKKAAKPAKRSAAARKAAKRPERKAGKKR